MWATLIFSGTAGMFLMMTLAALWHLRWVRRLPALSSLAAEDPAQPPPNAARTVPWSWLRGMRRRGLNRRFDIGVDDVECHWGTTVGNLVKIMEKNYFAALDYRLGLVLSGSVFVTFVFSVLVLGLLTGTAAGLAAGLSPLSLILPAGILARRLGWSWPCAVCMPFMFPVFFYTLLNSTFVTLRQGGIRWRETFYLLETLRAGNVR
jgi:hypothetical protein